MKARIRWLATRLAVPVALVAVLLIVDEGAPITLPVTTAGASGGYVQVPGWDHLCSGYCVVKLQRGANVELTAVDGSGTPIEATWIGACSGRSTICQFKMADNDAVVATFGTSP